MIYWQPHRVSRVAVIEVVLCCAVCVVLCWVCKRCCVGVGVRVVMCCFFRAHHLQHGGAQPALRRVLALLRHDPHLDQRDQRSDCHGRGRLPILYKLQQFGGGFAGTSSRCGRALFTAPALAFGVLVA